MDDAQRIDRLETLVGALVRALTGKRANGLADIALEDLRILGERDDDSRAAKANRAHAFMVEATDNTV